MLKLHQVTPTPDWWTRLNQFPDRLTYHTEEWIRFIAETQNATPVFADVCEGASHVGCFHSLMIRRFGLKILASPFPGWTTEYLGFHAGRRSTRLNSSLFVSWVVCTSRWQIAVSRQKTARAPDWSSASQAATKAI